MPTSPNSPDSRWDERVPDPDNHTTQELHDKLRAHMAALDGKSAPPPLQRYPRTATAVEIMQADLPEPNWAVRGLLPQGVAILAGKPKAGKSWLCLDLALAIAQGRPALQAADLTTNSGRVLYLALEDTAHRLQSRLRASLAGALPPANLRFTTRWERFPQGLTALGDYLKDFTDTRLVIVDTLAKTRALVSQAGNAYAEDYEIIGALKTIADRHKTTVLIVHHLRKAAMEDPLDAVSGSAGLTGAADTILVLARRRGANVARLYATGRDLDEQELTLAWADSPAGWSLATDESIDLPPWYAEMLRVVRAAEGGLTPAELAAATDRTPNAARVALFRLAQLGRVVKRDGRYHGAEPLSIIGAGHQTDPAGHQPSDAEPPHAA